MSLATESKKYLRFPLDKLSAIAWFEVAHVQSACAQVYATTAWGGSPVLEAVVSNIGTNATAVLYSAVTGGSTVEVSTSGNFATVDCLTYPFRWFGLRVKTAGSSGDTADIVFMGKAVISGADGVQVPNEAIGL